MFLFRVVTIGSGGFALHLVNTFDYHTPVRWSNTLSRLKPGAVFSTMDVHLTRCGLYGVWSQVLKLTLAVDCDGGRPRSPSCERCRQHWLGYINLASPFVLIKTRLQARRMRAWFRRREFHDYGCHGQFRAGQIHGRARQHWRLINLLGVTKISMRFRMR